MNGLLNGTILSGLWSSPYSRYWTLGTFGTPNPSIPNLPLGTDTTPAAGPVVAATNTYSDATGGTTHAVNLPTGITAGDLLLVFFVVHSTTATTPSGWTLIASGTNGDNNYIYGKIASGSEGSTVTITVGASQRATGISYRVTGWSGSLSDVAVSAETAETTTTPNPPSLAPTWALANNLWIAVTFANDGNYTFSSYPETFTLGQVALSTGAGTGNGIAVAAKNAKVYITDPPVFTTVTSRNRSTFTLAVRPALGKTLTAAAGSYSVSGQSAGLKLARKVAAAPGSYDITGQPSGTRLSRKVGAAPGSYTVTGTAAGLVQSRKIAAAPGSYTITGQAAGLSHGWVVPAAAGSYAVTGQPATLRKGWVLSAAAGSYALTGQPAGLKHGWKVSAAPGFYTLTGSDATLTKSGSTAKSITADPGSYTVTGQPATLRRGFVLGAAAGFYTVTGQPAGLKHGWKLAAAPGSYSLTGSPAGLRRGLNLGAGAGSYTVTGQPATLRRGLKVPAAAGAYALTGVAAGLRRSRVLAAAAGSYTLTGSAAALRRGLKIAAEPGSYAMTGTDAGLVYTPSTARKPYGQGFIIS